VPTDLELALELADLADEITARRFRADDLRVDTKPDMTPVSEVDRAVEQALRQGIARARHGDGVLGEEEGDDSAGRSRRWILDPVDGTRNYVRGVPVWATLIALEVEARVEVGVVSAPALGRRWWAARGQGAFADGRPIRVSAVARLDDAYISTTNATAFAGDGARHRYAALARRCWNARGLGDFWSHVLVAEGAVDVAVELPVRAWGREGETSGLGPWDVAANLVIVEEAGGRLTDLDGVARIDSGQAVSSNGLLHDEVLAALQP
jgi:histidinol-phosphatase